MFNVSPTQIYALKKALDKMDPKERDAFLAKVADVAKEMEGIIAKYGK